MGPNDLGGALSPPLGRHPVLPEGHEGCWPDELTTGIAGKRGPEEQQMQIWILACIFTLSELDVPSHTARQVLQVFIY